MDNLEAQFSNPKNLAGIFRNIEGGFCVLDNRYNVSFVNAKAAAIFEKTKKRLLNNTLWEVIPPDVKTALSPLLQIEEKKKRVFISEYFSGKHKKWFQIYMYPFPDGTALYFDDVSQRKATEEQLKTNEALFRVAMRNAPIGMAVLTPEGKYLEVNRAFCDIIGYSEEEVLMLDFQTITHPDDLATSDNLITQLLSGEITSFQFDKRYIHKDGHYVLVQLNVALVRDEKDSPQYLLTQTQDITQKKQYEQHLKESEERYEMLFNNVGDLIAVLDPEGNYIFVSPSHKTILGYEQDELMSINSLTLVHPDDLQSVMEQHEKILLMHEGKTQVRIRHKDGHYVTIESIGRAIFDGHGKPTVMVITSYDVSERIELERQKNEFIITASHELKTPLTILKGFALILERENGKTEKQNEYINKINTHINKLLVMINNLFDVSQISNIAMNFESIRLDTLAQEVVSDMSALNTKQTFVLNANIPVTITVDRYRMYQVLTNLLTNAVKYSGDGTKIIVTVTQDQAMVHIKVKDFGMGIAKGDQKKIFEPFFQSVNAPRKSQMGLGLGLHITSEIIKQHKGTIEVKSQLGKGSTFIVHLPLLTSLESRKMPGNLSARK